MLWTEGTQVPIYWRTRHAVQCGRFVIGCLAFAALPLGSAREGRMKVGQIIRRGYGSIFKDSA
jgi:hypothetical protein